MRMQNNLGTVFRPYLPLVAHMKLKASRNVTGYVDSRLVGLKFAKIVYFLSYCHGRRKKEVKRKMNKIEIFKFGFLDSVIS